MPEDWANGRPRRERGREGLLRLGDGSSQEYVWDAHTTGAGAVPGRCLLQLALFTPIALLARSAASLGFGVSAPSLDGLPRVVAGA